MGGRWVRGACERMSVSATQLTRALQAGLQFKPGKPAELEGALARLGAQLHGFRLALEYIADYVKLGGLRLWQEELAGVINFFVEQERNAFLRRRVHAWQSTHTRAAAAVNQAPPAAFEHSFFGRLVRELIALTSPRRAVYSEALGGCATIQAFGAVERFCSRQRERFDHNLKAGLMMEAVGIWLQASRTHKPQAARCTLHVTGGVVGDLAAGLTSYKLHVTH